MCSSNATANLANNMFQIKKCRTIGIYILLN